MARTPKKLGQCALNVSGSVVTVVTGAALGTQVTEVYLCNTGANTRKVTVLAHGAGVLAANMLFKTIELSPEESRILEDKKILLASGETLRMYQDAGTDVTATAYGIEVTV